jgi:hypothetical protein
MSAESMQICRRDTGGSTSVPRYHIDWQGIFLKEVPLWVKKGAMLSAGTSGGNRVAVVRHRDRLGHGSLCG